MKLESRISASLDAIRAELARTRLTTSTMNLVVWIDDGERRKWVLDRAALLGEKHPSRSLVFDHSGECGRATVTTSDRDALSQFTVQGEQVIIGAGDFTPSDVGDYVRALTRTGVPTIVWWTGERVGGPFFEALLDHAATLVVDSSGSVRDERALRDLVGFHAAHRSVVLRDLAWLRLRPWQDMIAHLFDDPAVIGELYAIRKLHIASGSDAEAFYLGGWLGSRLGWTASGRDAFADRSGETVRFERARRGEIRRVQSVCLDSDGSWYHGEVTDDAGVVRVWVEGEHAREPRLFPLQAVDNASLLERAVLETASDELYETAMSCVATLLG